MKKLVCAVIACAACSNSPSGGTVCTTEARAAINVNVRDSATNKPYQGPMVVRATTGAFSDSVKIATAKPDTFSVGMAYERDGTYTVTVQAPSYLDWQKSGVVVTKGVCHVDGVILTALLRH